MDPRLPRPIAATLLAVLLAMGAAACGDDDDDPTTAGDSGTTTSAPADAGGEPYDEGKTAGGSTGSTGEGTIVAADFTLSDLTVGPGEAIVLKNEDSVPHTATGDEGEFDTGRVAPGETSESTTAPEQPGSYTFHCEVHPDMTATLTVEG
jgi:plastocyanin